MWVRSWMNFRPPLISVRLPPALLVIEPSTVKSPEQTCGVVMTQYPWIALPVWSHPCAAAGVTNTDKVPIRPPIAVRATVNTLSATRASEPRLLIGHTSDGPLRRLQAGAGERRLRGHSFLAMQGVFI